LRETVQESPVHLTERVVLSTLIPPLKEEISGGRKEQEMITTRKRLLSLVLALTMVITLLPHTSFAAEKKEQKQGT
jgi:hypothetical protein